MSFQLPPSRRKISVTRRLKGTASGLPPRWAVARWKPTQSTRICRLRRPASLQWVKLENGSARSRFQRMVDIDLIGDTDEPDAERHTVRERTKDVAKEANALGWVQLGCTHF